MAELVFVEGVSGVGKSTMVRALTKSLREGGLAARGWVEFDSANPIDFYCTAYLPRAEYARLLRGWPALADHAVEAGAAVLVRYYDEDTPLYPEPLLTLLRERELCYHPARPIPMEEYAAAYRAVWRRFGEEAREQPGFLLFDGSLLHHPVNDLMRNYGATPEQSAAHVGALLAALRLPWRVFYLFTDDLPGQLGRAHLSRGQEPPTQASLAFWRERASQDRFVLERAVRSYTRYDVTRGGWDEARTAILSQLTGGMPK